MSTSKFEVAEDTDEEETRECDTEDTDYEGDDEEDDLGPQRQKLENLKSLFRQHLLNTTANQRVVEEISKINRRLTSLARLLETNQICTAVRYDPVEQQLVISSNLIHSKSRETNQSVKLLQDIMELLANHDASMRDIIEQLAKIIATNLCQEQRFLIGKTPFGTIQAKVGEQLISLYESGKPTKVWSKSMVDESKQDQLSRLITKRTSRIARDFAKLRRSIIGLSHAAGEEKAILEAMRDKKMEICRDGGKDEHAEVRQAHELSASDSPAFLGISKLCCARCALTVQVLNIPTSGNHGRVFNRWGFPGFFDKNPKTRKAFLGPAASTYDALSAEEKKIAQAIISDGKGFGIKDAKRSSMLPDTSDSDEVFGDSALKRARLASADSDEEEAVHGDVSGVDELSSPEGSDPRSDYEEADSDGGFLDDVCSEENEQVEQDENSDKNGYSGPVSP